MADVLKALCNVVALVIALPAAATVWLEEAANPGGEGAFTFWAHLFALLPGHVGVFIRRGFYRLTLDGCDATAYIGFGSFFSHRYALVEREVYIGSFAVIGSVTLRSGCLIGTRASLLSGSSQHTQREDGRWISDGLMFRSIEIGRNTWIGEAATIMADVGEGSVISAGAVVSAPVTDGVIVAGNPARFVRKTDVDPTRLPPGGAPARRATGERVPFLDWLKFLGMFLIVYGHVAAGGPLVALRPIMVKQLGVAFFLFATAYSLTTDTRPKWRVAFNRLFEMYLFGVPLALLLSLLSGQALVSNYLPYVGGANVLFDFFPANPTSWYVGTYFHVVILWTVWLRRVTVTPKLIVLTCLAEIVIRALLMQTAGLYVSYMLISNWATVFLLGCAAAAKQRPRLVLSPTEGAAMAMTLLAALVLWTVYGASLPWEDTFPFKRLALGSPMAAALLVSGMVTFTYVSVTAVVVAITQSWPAPATVRAFARNTLIVFLAHMPVYYALAPRLMARGYGRPVRGTILVLVCLPGLALVSEAVRRITRPRALRERLFATAGMAEEAPSTPAATA